MKMNGAQVFLECLKQEGIKYIFGNPGTTEIALLDSLVEKPDITYILTLHESVALAMADGFSRAGGIGFVNVHTAMGTANSIGNLYNAHHHDTPLIMTIANKDARILGRECFSEVPDLLGMTRQFTKWSWQVLMAEELAENLIRSFKIATTPPMGPVFLSIPENFLSQEVDIEIPVSSRFKSPLKVKAPSDYFAQAAKLILEAQRPLLIAGNGIGKAEAVADAVELAELLGCPVVTEGRYALGFMNFPTQHPLYRGMFDPLSDMVQSCDLLLGIGCDIFVQTSYAKGYDILRTIKTVHIHSKPEKIGQLYPVEVPIQTDISEGLAGLLDHLNQLISNDKKLSLDERRQKYIFEGEQLISQKNDQVQTVWGQTPIAVARLIKEINEVLEDDAIIVDEAMQSSRGLLKYYNFKQPGTYFRTGGYLGWGAPSALGIKLALPERQVIALVGDGSFYFSTQALWTAARYNIPVIIIVCNNREYKTVRSAAIRSKGIAAQKNIFIGSSIDQPAPNPAQIAEGFGVQGITIEKPEKIRPALDAVIKSGKPAVLDVRIEQ
jgi:benzoylformate decarboxylase